MAKSIKNLSIYYQNVRGLRTKTDIRANISASQHDVIIFTEHWLNENFSSSEYFDDSYSVERYDRKSANKERGGGALVAIKNGLAYKRVSEWENESNFENVWIELRSNSLTDKYFINVVYIPPQTKYDEYSRYFDSITEIMCMREPNAKFLIVGDFNLGASIEWYLFEGSCIPLSHNGETASELVNTMAINELMQMNSIRNINGRILDLLLTNTDISIHSAQPLTNIDSHHPPFIFNLVASNLKFIKPKKTIKLNFYKANYFMINNELSQLHWEEIFAGLNLDDMVNKFYEVLHSIINRYTPIIQPKDDRYPKWFTQKIIQLISDKKFFHDKYKKTSLEFFNDIFKVKRRELKYELKASEKRYTDSIEKIIKTNTKSFFAYTKSLNKTNKLPCTMNLKGESSEDPKVIANYFASNFEKVYSPIDNNLHLHNLQCTCDNHFVLSDSHITEAINSLNENKSTSPDNIPTIFYKRTMPNIITPLKILFSQSLCSRTFPKKWKLSFIIPLHKNGDKSNVENYRPISIISAISKIFEKVMYAHIYQKVGHLIVPQQHGFAKKKSTISNLAEYVNFLSNNMTKGGQVDTIYTDFQKAFDIICHILLINKLDRFPIDNCTKAWLYSFLTERSQMVCVNGTKSRTIHPTSSVPQGSVLSALLFSLFINDLPSILSCHVLLFADDCKIFTKIKSISDCIKLQKDLDKLHDWCTRNQLYLNVKKCTAISFTRRTEATHQFFNYSINGSLLNRSKVVKDLGILFDEKLSFINQVNSMVHRASKLLGFIFRSLKPFTKISTHLTLFYSYIRNLLEYGSQIWNTYYHTYTNTIENIQRKFTRMICYKFKMPRGTYQSRLKSLNMISLFHRRVYIDEVLLYKIVSGKLVTNITDSFPLHVPNRTTRYAPIFYLPPVTSNAEFYSLTLRLKRQHNENFASVDLFENSISKTKKKIFSELPIEMWRNFR